MSLPGTPTQPVHPTASTLPPTDGLTLPPQDGHIPQVTDDVRWLPCVHCGESTPRTPTQNDDLAFCCNGCRGAYQLIHGWGLEDFYALREQMKLTSSPRSAEQGGRFERFDSPELLGDAAPKTHSDGTCSVELAVHGLHCAACAWLIEKAAQNHAGWLSARIRMNRHTLELRFDPGQTGLSQIARLLDKLGYQLAPLAPQDDQHLTRENKRHLIHIAIAGFLAANAMWIAVGLYAGDFSGLSAEHRYFMTLIGTALGLTAVAWPGRTFLRGGIAALRTWTPHMDLPIALGLSVGSLAGLINALRGTGHVYFDSMAILVFLLLIGRWVQFRQQNAAARAVDLMLRITPRHCTILRDGDQRQTVLVDTLVAGDTIVIDAGESIAADGTIVSGETSLDRSLLSGESRPCRAGVGADVAAGVVNITSPIHAKVACVGANSRIGQVMQAVESAATEKTAIVKLADRVGGIFVVAVMALSAVTFAVWLPTNLATAAAHATSLLIVACPCALALATPLAIAVSLGKAARSGILIRDGQVLQNLSRRGQVWLDKTGTLTLGKQQVTHRGGNLDCIALAAALEEGFRHPAASAIVREAERLGLRWSDHQVEHSAARLGGVTGIVNGQSVAIGNLGLMREANVDSLDAWGAKAHSLVTDGQSPVFIAVDGSIELLLGISDPLRDGARQMVGQLKRLGWQVGILSGDHPDIVLRVGQQVGISAENCTGAMSPEDKLNRIRTSGSAGPVMMIGDGANDAAALARADIGVAIRGGAEVSLQAAPVFLTSGCLQSIPNLVIGARRTTRLIYGTFAISLLYNLVAVALAISGWISPFVAAILMPASSVSVLAVTLAARTFPPEVPR